VKEMRAKVRMIMMIKIRIPKWKFNPIAIHRNLLLWRRKGNLKEDGKLLIEKWSLSRPLGLLLLLEIT
jgi:hypothetical protein